MVDENIVIDCRDCDHRASFATLGRARVGLTDHESEQGHDVDW